MNPDYVGRINRSFWELARTVHSTMQAALRARGYLLIMNVATLADPGLLDSLYLEKYGLIHHRTSQLVGKLFGLFDIAFGMSISNLGSLDITKDYGAFRLASIVGPMVFSDIIEKFFGVLTYGGRMQLCMVTSEKAIDSTVAQQVLDGAITLLVKESSE